MQVCRILTLVSENQITFKSTAGSVWTAIVPKGNQFEFNETVWGATTKRYLEPIKALSNEDFTLIVEDTQIYVKKSATSANTTDLVPEDDSDYEELFTFR